MIEKRSIVLTGVVLAMLFAGALLFLWTSGGLQQARIAVNEAQDLSQQEEQANQEEEELDALEALDERAAGAAENAMVAGVTRAAMENGDIDEEGLQDIAPTAATGVKGYVVMAAGLAVLMGLIGLVTAWRKSSARQVEL